MTISQQFQVKEFPFEIKDSNRNQIYYENSNGYWEKKEYDSNRNQIYYENSNGYWEKKEFDSKGNQIYWENSNGYWEKKEYDSNRNQIYWENSDGSVMDNRPKSELTLAEIADKFGIPLEQLRIRD